MLVVLLYRIAGRGASPGFRTRGAVKAGDLVAGYRIEKVLGRGGMGTVYEATQLSLNRTVALKILAPQFTDDVHFRERFRREGHIQAAIDHPHIVTVYEAGEADEGLFLAMRLVRGSTLKDMIVGRDLEGARTLRLLRPIADALDTAHEVGLTHRDIKPQNILVGVRDHAFLADFGLTKDSTQTGLTRTGQFVGTIDYIAPEQIRGEQACAASDIYALTAVLYECLCGVVPYSKPSDAAVLFAHISERPPLVTDQRPELPAALDDVISRGMAKEPSERQATATDLIAEAERAFGRRVRAVITPPGPVETPEDIGLREEESRVSTRESRIRGPLPDEPAPADTIAGATAAAATVPDGAPPADAEDAGPAAGARDPTDAPSDPAPEIDDAPADPAPTEVDGPDEATPFDAVTDAPPSRTSAVDIAQSTKLTAASSLAGGQQTPAATDSSASDDPPVDTEATRVVADDEARGEGQATSPAETVALPIPAPAEARARTPPAGERDTRAGGRLVAGAMVAVLVLAVAAFAFGRKEAERPVAAAGTALTNSASNADVLMRMPATWRRTARSPDIDGLELEDAMSLAAGPKGDAGLVVGRVEKSGSALLPVSFERRAKPPPTLGDPIRTAHLEGYRQRGLKVAGYAGTMDVLAAPTSGATVVFVCFFTATTVAVRDECSRVVNSARLVRAKAGRVAVDAAYAGRLNRVLRSLDRQTASRRRALRKARTPRGQSRIAASLARVHRHAARDVRRADPPAVARPANRALGRAFGDAARGYGRLASAASSAARSRYARARRAVTRAERDARRALKRLEPLGYQRLSGS